MRRTPIVVLCAMALAAPTSMTVAATAAPVVHAAAHVPANAPKVTVTRTTRGFKLRWTGVAGARGYHVWMRQAVGGDAGDHDYLVTGEKWVPLQSAMAASTRSTNVGASAFTYETHANYASAAWGVSAFNSAGDGPIGASRAGCAKAYFVSARGSGQNPSSSDDNGYAYGMGRYGYTVYRQAMTRLHIGPGQFQADSVNYPARSVQWWGTVDPEQYKMSRDSGIAVTRTIIRSIVGHCTRARIIVSGFSQGADAVAYAFNRSSASTKKHITMLQLIADPHRNVADRGIRFRPAEKSQNGWYGPRHRFTHRTDGYQIETWCGSDDDICSRSGTVSVPNHVSYDCDVQWAAESIAARARSIGWKPKADLTHPTCTMAY